MVDMLNHRWHLQYSLSQWRKCFDTIWSTIIEPKIAHYSWCLAFQGLYLGLNSNTLGFQTTDASFLDNQSLSCIYSGSIGMPKTIGIGFITFSSHLGFNLFLGA